MKKPRPGYIHAMIAALLFGASTPAAKILLKEDSPWLLAGLLYLGSGIGLFIVRFLQRQKNSARSETSIHGSDWRWLIGATCFGGILAPVLLLSGLSRMDAGSASLFLNFEGVLTALLAWMVFNENFDRRILTGMAMVLGGGLILSWPSFSGQTDILGIGFIVSACLAWAIDNNLTKKISAYDALQIAMIKGLAAGATNTSLAILIFRPSLVPVQVVLGCFVGFLGYGVSLYSFVLALRTIGASRTGAYFSLAPFVGSGIALLIGDTNFSWQLLGASILMGFGVWLHLTENHDHEHVHEFQEHDHQHFHDEHHLHDHIPGDPQSEPHSHRHRHEKLVHTHRHFPDTHHNHQH